MTVTSSSPSVSVVVPAFNEAENLPVLVETIAGQFERGDFEILIVDDGSTDETTLLLDEMAERLPYVSYISFSRNFGHQNAIKAGLDHARGACVITMDADMQHPPTLLPQMLALWRDGADVVNTCRYDTSESSFFKNTTSKWFYRLLSKCSSMDIHPGSADFRLLDRKVVELCREMKEDVFFWRGLIPWLGFNQVYLDYTPDKRLHGETKYSFCKMLRLAWSGISSFSLLPLRAATIMGGFFLCLSALYLVYTVYCVLSGIALPGWASLMAVLIGMGAVQLICLGVVGEYVGKTYFAAKKRPVYIVKKMNIPQ